MLSIFPELLFLGRLSPAIIRVAVAVALLYTAYYMLTRAHEIMRERLPIIGHPPFWVIVLGSAVGSAIGVAILLGSWTQPMALLAAAGSLKLMYFARRSPSIAPLPVSACFMLLAMSLSLVFTGAGAFAFDLPL